MLPLLRWRRVGIGVKARVRVIRRVRVSLEPPWGGGLGGGLYWNRTCILRQGYGQRRRSGCSPEVLLGRWGLEQGLVVAFGFEIMFMIRVRVKTMLMIKGIMEL